jgi:hypothetical protein
MNSMGVNPFVQYLYNDLKDGNVIFQLYDIIKPGCVNWTKVIKKFNKMRMNFEKLGKIKKSQWRMIYDFIFLCEMIILM